MKLAVLGLVAGILWSSAAGAQVNDNTRAAARDLGYSGVERYQAGDYQVAFSKLDKAYQVLQAPSLGLWSARALVKLNRFVEAAERYRQVEALTLRGGDAGVQQQAIADAKHELEELTPRIPRLVVRIEGADAQQVRVTVDGELLAPALLGEPFPSNPGTHEIVGQLGAQQVQQSARLGESEQQSLVLRFEATPAAGAGPAAATPERAPATQATAAASGSGRKLAGWVLVGAGAAGVVFGGVTASIAASKKSSLEGSGDCRQGLCLKSHQDEVDSYNAMRTYSTIGFIAGGVVAAAGITLVLTAPKPEAERTAQVSGLWLGAGAGRVALGGRF